MNGAPTDRLNSWKEISGYLKRTVRTAQRWESTEALPVHRHSHDKRDSVYAYKAELDGWWAARQCRLDRESPKGAASGAAGIAAWMRRHRAATAGLGVMVLAAVALSWRMARPPLGFSYRDWVLIADFDNQTGDPLLEKGLWTAFTAAFQQSTHANIIPSGRIEGALKRMGKDSAAKIDEKLGREICVRENGKVLIASSIAADGGGYLLVTRIVDPKSGETVKSYSEHARARDRIVTTLGKLAGEVRRDLGESLRSIRQSDRPLPELTTPSLEALQFYAEGRYRWQKGQYGQAVRLFESALEHDPDFAMAHASLGNAYFSHVYSDPVRGRQHYERALQRVDRLTDRERLYIEATYQTNLGHVAEAVELFKIYLNAYPDDSAARYRLGSVLMLHDRFQEAVEQFQEAIRTDPASARTYTNLATSYGELGDSAKSLGAYARAFALEPAMIHVVNLNHEYGFALVKAGNNEKARELFTAALSDPETQAGGLRSLALLDMYEGRYGSAEERLRESVGLTEARQERLHAARDRLFLAILLEGEGDHNGELAELGRAERDLQASGVPVNWLAARIGVSYARAGALPKARGILNGLRHGVDPRNPRDGSELHRLEGEVALSGGDGKRSTEFLLLAGRESDNPLTVESLAHAFDRLRDVRAAIPQYERLIAMRHRALGWEPQQSWLAAHAWLAEAYLSHGEGAKAKAVSGELARLWTDADPQLPLAKAVARIQAKLGDGAR